MAKRVKRETPATSNGTVPAFVVVTNKSYGKALRNQKIYFEGKRPAMLSGDGRMQLGKHILEALSKKYQRFRWTITLQDDSITLHYGVVRVHTSQALLKRMVQETWDRTRDIKTDVVARFFSTTFPQEFLRPTVTTYVPGTLAGILDSGVVPRLTVKDKEALSEFIPQYVASEAIGTVQQLKATAQIETLKELARSLEEEIGRSHPESWWQGYVKSNILLMQQGYIKSLDKLNVSLGNTKFPDFCLVTHDNYLDILEIKRPDTELLRLDSGRGNYYWDAEMSKAISQTENYIEEVASKASDVRSYLLDREKIDVKAVRPRGIILAGDARTFTDQKQKDDFRLLSQGIKALSVLTYDELLTRLRNYIGVLETFTRTASSGSKRHRKGGSK